MKNKKGRMHINEFWAEREIHKVEVWVKHPEKTKWELAWQGIGSPLVGRPKPPGEIWSWGYRFTHKAEEVSEIPKLRKSERKTVPTIRFVEGIKVKGNGRKENDEVKQRDSNFIEQLGK